MHSEGILSGELKHGPLAMIDKDMPCIMVITKDNTYKVGMCIIHEAFLLQHGDAQVLLHVLNLDTAVLGNLHAR